jgi:hypothetical protein
MLGDYDMALKIIDDFQKNMKVAYLNVYSKTSESLDGQDQ